MILEETTKEVFGYWSDELSYGSVKPILAACEFCGEFRVSCKHDYRTFCGSGIKRYRTEGSKVKISVTLKGRTFTKEHKANMSTTHKGIIFSETHKANLCKNHVDFKGDKNPRWLGGIRFEPYCVKVNNAFKEYIRSKFGYKCFLCSKTQAENGRKLSVHHVNYNKNCGCDGDKTCNFVPRCISCHTKTNGNRDYYQKLIMEKLYCIIIGWDV